MAWGETLARLAYSCVLRLGTPVYLLRLWWRGRVEPGYRQHIAQRFGLGLDALPALSPGMIWLHAVSLGETRAAAALIAALRAERPGMRLLLTHGTATGRAAGEALLQPGDVQVWLPVDTPGAVRRFLRAARPVVGVLMETEIWPNLIHEAGLQKVPLVLANARLSARSARKGQRLSALLGPAGRALTLALAQSEDDAERLRRAGVPRVQVAGNLKYDLSPGALLQARGQAWRATLARPVLAMTNSRDGEEALLLQAWAGLPQPRPLLLLVPRHPQRFEAVAAMVQAHGFTLQRRSLWSDAPPADSGAADVWLGDTLGEMSLYYSLADVALLGGSFLPLGGHNLIEAAAHGCPLVMGPSTFNFAEAADLALGAQAAWRAADLPAALAQALAVLADRVEREQASQRGLRFASAHRGAAHRMAQAIVGLLPSSHEGFSAPAAG